MASPTPPLTTADVEPFEIWPQLASSTHKVVTLPLCEVLLNDDKTWPWLILVPRVPGAVELHDLSEDDQTLLMREITLCSRAIQRQFNPDKINTGALGCVCRQLHVHVLGRFENDPVWPAPVWGATKPVEYEAEEVSAVTATMRAAVEAAMNERR